MKLAQCRGRRQDGYRCRLFGEGDTGDAWLCHLHEKQSGDGDWLLLPTLGPIACDFIEDLLCHGPGDIQGDPVKLIDEEVAFIYGVYEFVKAVDENNKSILDREGNESFNLLRYLSVLCRAKGFRKTELLGWIGMFELFGECRPDGFDANGDLVGKPTPSARVGSVATEEGQAGESLEVGRYIAQEKLVDDFDMEILVDEIKMKDGSRSEWSVMTSSPNARDGAKTTCLLMDEPHLWTSSRLHNLYEMIMRQLPKRRSGGMAVAATTAWRPGGNSVAESTYDTFLTDPGGGVMFDLRSAPPDIDHTDKEAVIAGLRHAYGGAWWVPVEKIWQTEFLPIGIDPNKTIGAATRYFFNRPASPESRYMPNMKIWKDLGPDKTADDYEPRVLPKRTKIVIGFDGSKTGDSTQMVGVTLDDGYIFELGSWERPQELNPDEEWEVQREWVEERMAWVQEQYKVVLVVADPAFWTTTVDKWGTKLNTVPFNFSSYKQVGAAFKLLKELIAQKEVSHDGSDVLYRHMSNACMDIKGATNEERDGFISIRKKTPNSVEWIDATTAMGLAVWGVKFAIENKLSGTTNIVTRTWGHELLGIPREDVDPDAEVEEPDQSDLERRAELLRFYTS